MKEDIKESIAIEEGLNVKYENDLLTLKGAKGESSRLFNDPRIKIQIDQGNINMSADKATKREKALLFTTKAHIKNMIKGVMEGHLYELKICSSHFPMNVSISNGEVVIKNFLGERNPRIIKVLKDVDVKIEGEIIKITSCEKEKAGQMAANIEKGTKIKNRDNRKFQDGIYITNKDGKKL